MSNLNNEMNGGSNAEKEIEILAKEGFLYSYSKNSDKWKKVYGEIKKGTLSLFKDNYVKYL
jgi:hypothetical protein